MENLKDIRRFIIQGLSLFKYKDLLIWCLPDEEIDEKSSLTILQKMNKIIDVTHAIHYHNHECQTPMIQFDIKPHHILLIKTSQLIWVIFV